MTLEQFSRNSSSKYGRENNLKKNSDISNSVTSKSPVKTPTKSSLRLRNKISSSNSKVFNQFSSNENTSDDNGIVGSSQNTTESKLRKKIKKNLSKSSNSPKKTPLKVNNIPPSDSPDKNLSFGDICDVSSSIIKEEIDEILHDIEDYESITLTHDLSQVLEYSPQAICSIKMELLTEEEDNVDEIQQDPLFIDDKDNHTKIANVKSITRKRSNIKRKSKEIEVIEPPKRSCIKSFSKLSKNMEKEVFLKTKSEIINISKINLQHTVPPQHKIENTAGSRQLTEEQIQEFEKYAPLKKGPFTKSEDKCIKENWKIFCEVHNWDEETVKPFLYMRHTNGFYISDLNERQNFVRFLANGLPWRSLYSVYFRFRNLYTSRENKGKYTAKEDKIIMNYMKKAPKRKLNNVCAEVAKILNRKRHSVWQHYEILKKKHNLPHSKNNSIKYKSKIESQHKSNYKKKKENKQKRGQIPIYSFRNSIDKPIYSNVNWTAPLVKKFIDALIEVTSCKEVEDLENRLISQETWKELENRTRIDCDVLEKFWNFQLHMQLFCTKEICLDTIKVKLIEYLYEKRLQYLENIKWEIVQMDFPGLTVIFLTKLFEQLTEYAKNNIDSSEFSDIIEYLYKNVIPEICKKPRAMVLPHLIYKNERFIINSNPEVKILRETHNPLNEIPINSFRNSIDKPIYSNVNWTAPLVKKFIDALIEVTSCKEVEDLENRLISQETWKELENRTRIDCDVLEKFWNFQLHMQLFCTKEICLDTIKVKLIEYLYEKRLQYLENIKWEIVQMDFPGLTVIFLTKLFELLTEYAKNNIDSSEFSDIMEYLHKTVIPEIYKKPRAMVLPHLIYKSGRFIINSNPEVKILRETHNPLNEIPINSFRKSIDKTIYSNVKWTTPLVKKFIDALIDVTSCKEVEDLENRLISQETWKELENRIRIECDVLEKFWNFQLHMQLFCTKEICLDTIKVKLIEYLYEKRLQYLENIKWEIVQMDFPGVTVIFLTKLFEQLIEYAKNNIDSSEFSDIMEYLHKNVIPEIYKKSRAMVLPHLIYKSGRFIINSNPEVKILRETHNPLNEI